MLETKDRDRDPIAWNWITVCSAIKNMESSFPEKIVRHEILRYSRKLRSRFVNPKTTY
jgi:hypothetical protein